MTRTLLSALLAVAGLGCATSSPRPATSPGDEAVAPGPAAAAPAPVTPEEPWRAQAPPTTPAPTLVPPAFQRAALPNGLTVLVSERHELPVVAIDVAFAAGSAVDPPRKGGLASLTYELLLEGTGARDALALDDAFADLGATPDVSVSYDGATVGVQVLRRNLEPVAALLAEVVMRPRLDAQDFERKQQERLADLAFQVGNPRYLSREAVAASVFGEGHPYGHLATGSPESVKALKAADAKAFYNRRAGPKAAAVVFAGDITLPEAVAIATRQFGGWKGSAPRPGPPPEPRPVAERKGVVLVPKPGLDQTSVVLARTALAAGATDEVPLMLASSVAGGFFGSRLNMNLRESKGYSYGVFSGLDVRRGRGVVQAGGAMRADVTGAAVTEMLNELAGLKARPITDAELAAAKEGLVRSLPSTFDTVGALAGAAAGLFFKGLPLDRYAKLMSALEKADRATVQVAAEKYLDPGRMTLLLVGDPQVIRSQLAPLGLGQLEERAPRTGEPAPRPPATGLRD